MEIFEAKWEIKSSESLNHEPVPETDLYLDQEDMFTATTKANDKSTFIKINWP